MKIKTSELTGQALDWAVAKCEGRGLKRNPMGSQGGHGWWIWEETSSGKGGILIDKSVYMEIGPHTQPKTRNSGDRYSPSTDWAQCGPIIDRELIQLTPHCTVNPLHGWAAAFRSFDEENNVFALHLMRGRTPLTAAMRCYVTSKLGDEIEIPEELL